MRPMTWWIRLLRDTAGLHIRVVKAEDGERPAGVGLFIGDFVSSDDAWDAAKEVLSVGALEWTFVS